MAKKRMGRGSNAAEGIRLLERSITQAEALCSQSVITQTEVDAWHATTLSYLERIFGAGTPNVDRVMNAQTGRGYVIGMDKSYRSEYLRSGLSNKVVMLRGCIDLLTPDAVPTDRASSSSSDKKMAIPNNKKVFIVHGHDGGAKDSVARYTETLGLKSIILNEVSNGGRTIITKLSEEAQDVGFAIVLMTPDDEGRRVGRAKLKSRARQNVVFELGFFIGKLGSNRVAAMMKGNVEKPSNLGGVLYISLDKEDWRQRLASELRAAHMDGDWTKVF
jgi:predicted nucleotide-binding protein